MSFHFAGHRPGFRCATLSSALLVSCLCLSPAPVLADIQDDILAEPGQTALLTIRISVEGSVVAPQARKDEVVRWSTERRFEASVRMVAEDPEQISFSAMTGDEPAAMPQVYSDLAKRVEACGEDQACVMRVAMQIAGSPELKEATEAAPPYQLWKAADEDALVDVKARYLDKWYTLFYVSGPEITECTLTAPMVSPELVRMDPNAKATWDQINRETLQAGAEAFVIETDATDGTSKLHLPLVAAGSGDEKCTLTIGGNPETQHTSTNGTVIPVGEMKSPLVLKGSAPGNGVISSGSEVIETRLLLTQLGAAFAVEVSVPLTVKVSWELKKQ